MKEEPTELEVLIAGAGPTGLVLALWLTRLGVRLRIIDRLKEPDTTSRALAVQARTLELYRQIGLAEELVDRGAAAQSEDYLTTHGYPAVESL
jgi:2-polyprenyl-6-methoxyphenol hydroxylase-like FAD-dependent oxidoreductase